MKVTINKKSTEKLMPMFKNFVCLFMHENSVLVFRISLNSLYSDKSAKNIYFFDFLCFVLHSVGRASYADLGPYRHDLSIPLYPS